MTHNARPAAASSPPAPPRDEERNRRLLSIVESAIEAMIACDRERRILAWNRGASRLFGRDADEVLGWDVGLLFPEGHREGIVRLAREALDGRRSDLLRSVGVMRDGALVDLSVTVAPRRGEGDEVEGFCMVARDVSTRRQAEERAARDQAELQQREMALREALAALRKSHEDLKVSQLQLVRAAKLESVGRLAAGVAHEVKNPLAIILAGTEFLLGSPKLGAKKSKEVLEDIHAAVKRGGSVIGGLLNYSAAAEITPSIADVNEVIDRAVRLVQYACSRNRVEVVLHLTPDLPRLNLDVGRIEQVLVNLFMNAIDAMAQGGTLTIRTRRTQLTAADRGAGYRRTDPVRVGQTIVRVDIEDTGPGIPSENLTKVFDPFFTTKPAGKGTGLGLAVCKTIVAMHGGNIWIGNRPQGGAAATVVLASIAA